LLKTYAMARCDYSTIAEHTSTLSQTRSSAVKNGTSHCVHIFGNNDQLASLRHSPLLYAIINLCINYQI